MQRILPIGLAAGAVLWSAVLLAAPYALTSTNGAVVSAAAAVYSAAGMICHQRAARSFHLAGVQLPVCARCAGLYFSGALGAIVAWLISTHPIVPRTTRQVLLVATLPTALSVGIELAGLAHPSNVVRALCSMPLGAAAAWIFVQSLRAESGSVFGVRLPVFGLKP